MARQTKSPGAPYESLFWWRTRHEIVQSGELDKTGTWEEEIYYAIFKRGTEYFYVEYSEFDLPERRRLDGGEADRLWATRVKPASIESWMNVETKHAMVQVLDEKHDKLNDKTQHEVT